MKKTSNKLPKRFKEKWIKALRSGKYKQTDGALYDKKEDGYCCLGVAGSICGVPDKTLIGFCFLYPDKFNNTKGLPKLIIGGNSKSEVDYSPVAEKLSTYNDSGKSFKWIASYIERYL